MSEVNISVDSETWHPPSTAVKLSNGAQNNEASEGSAFVEHPATKEKTLDSANDYKSEEHSETPQGQPAVEVPVDPQTQPKEHPAETAQQQLQIDMIRETENTSELLREIWRASTRNDLLRVQTSIQTRHVLPAMRIQRYRNINLTLRLDLEKLNEEHESLTDAQMVRCQQLYDRIAENERLAQSLAGRRRHRLERAHRQRSQ